MSVMLLASNALGEKVRDGEESMLLGIEAGRFLYASMHTLLGGALSVAFSPFRLFSLTRCLCLFLSLSLERI